MQFGSLVDVLPPCAANRSGISCQVQWIGGVFDVNPNHYTAQR